VTVEVALPPLTVWADSDKLLQVLINLLENAAIHGPDHETVTLGAELDPADPAWALVTVRDRGTPLPEEGLERLFAPHARGGPRSARGTGLGLYIVRSIAQRWGGRAWGRPLESGNEFGFSVQVR
jgi:signal transduction histidine kinase